MESEDNLLMCRLAKIFLDNARFQDSLRDVLEPPVPHEGLTLSVSQSPEMPSIEEINRLSVIYMVPAPVVARMFQSEDTVRTTLVELLKAYMACRDEAFDLDAVAHALYLAEHGTGRAAFMAAIRHLCVKRPAVLAESTVREVAGQLHTMVKGLLHAPAETPHNPRQSKRRRELLDDKPDISEFGYTVRGDRMVIERKGVPYRLTAPKAVRKVNELIRQLYADPKRPDVRFTSEDAKNFSHGIYRKFYDECVRRVKIRDVLDKTVVLTQPKAHLRLPGER